MSGAARLVACALAVSLAFPADAGPKKRKRATTHHVAAVKVARSLASAGGFRSCAEARAAGAAPVRRGDRGYSTRLDRDGDGVGCE